jgi:polyhydroxyalkanoate synthase
MSSIFRALVFLMFVLNSRAFASQWRTETLSNWQMGSNQSFVAQTSDGWVLPLYRFTPRVAAHAAERNLPPVVLFHGMGANRFNLAQTGPSNLAVWLASRGRDVFVVELRGAGRSVDLTPGSNTESKWEFDFDTYREKDVPAILSRIKEITGSPEVDWVGHSMGGMLLYAIAGHDGGFSGDVRVRRAVAIASPGMIEGLPLRVGVMLRLATIFPSNQLPNRLWLQTVSLFYPDFVPDNEASLGFKTNYDPMFARAFVANVGANVSRGLARQIHAWHGRGGIFSRDGLVNYTADLAKSSVPIRFIGASKDYLASQASVQKAFDAAGGEKKLTFLGKGFGNERDYGHTDVVAGRFAALDSFPLVESWLSESAARIARKD